MSDEKESEKGLDNRKDEVVVGFSQKKSCPSEERIVVSVPVNASASSGLNQPARKRKGMFKLKFHVLKFLEFPSGPVSLTYHSLVFVFTVAVIICTIFSTVTSIAQGPFLTIYISLELSVVTIYLVEFALRVWSCSVIENYKGWRRLEYIHKPYMLIDLFILASSVPLLVFYFLDITVNADVILFLKALQILRFLHFERYHGSVKLMTKVLYVHRNELFTGYSASLMLIIFTAFVIYIAEKDSPTNEIGNIPQSLYFSVISFLTIGYGDVVPTTAVAKILIVILAFLGVALAAVPSGIIGSGFALQVASKAKKNQKKLAKKPATILLQRALRLYLYESDVESTLEKVDLEKFLNNPKTKRFVPASNIVTSQNNNLESHSFDITYPDETFNLPSTNQNTVTSEDRTGGKYFKKLFYSKREVLRTRRSSNRSKMSPEKFKKVIRLVTMTCRYFYMVAAAKKFVSSRFFLTTDEILEDFNNKHNSILHQIEIIRKKLNIQKNHNVQPSNDQSQTQAGTSVPPTTFISEIDLSRKISHVEASVRNLEESVSKILSILQKQD